MEPANQDGTKVKPEKSIPEAHDGLGDTSQKSATVTEVLQKTPVPDDVALQKAMDLVRDLFKDEYAKAKTSTEKAGLAKQLAAKADETGEDRVGRYALLRAALDLSVEAQDVDNVLAVVDRIANDYDVNTLVVKGRLLRQLANSESTTVKRLVAKYAYDLTDEAFEAEEPAMAEAFFNMATSLALAVKDKALVPATRSREAQVRQSAATMTAYKVAAKKLNDSPDDRDANSIVGAWYCFRNDDWERGLPYLAKGSDPSVKSLAELDIAVPSDPTKQTELGDGWSEQAQRTSDTANANAFRRRACHWYTSALPNLTGLAKLSVEKKLDALRSEIESVKESDTTSNLGSSTGDSEQFLVDFVRRFIEELRRIAQLDTDAQKRVEHAKAMDRFGAEMKRHTLVFRFPIENIVRENDGRGYLLRFGRPMGLGDMEEQIRYEDEARHVDLQESKALSLGRGAVCEIRGKGRFVLDRRELPLQERGAWWVLSIYPRVPGIESGRYDVFLVNGRVAYKSLDSTDEARSQTP